MTEQETLNAKIVDSIDSLRNMGLPSGTNVILKGLRITETKELLEMIALNDNIPNNSNQVPLTGFINPEEFKLARKGVVVDISALYHYERSLGSYTGKHPEIHRDLNEYVYIYKINLSN